MHWLSRFQDLRGPLPELHRLQLWQRNPIKQIYGAPKRSAVFFIGFVRR